MQVQFAQTAKKLLDEQLETTLRINALLSTEHDILSARNTENLATTVQEKKLHIEHLEKLNQSWQQTLRLVKTKFTLKGITTTLSKADPQGEYGLLTRWQKLGQQAKECQRLNLINGATIELRQQVTEQMLSMLRGQAAESHTYNPKGIAYNSQPTTGGQIAKA